MLNRSQLTELAVLFSRNAFFAPKDVIRYISALHDASYDQNSEIAKLLHHIAYGNPTEVKTMLDANPRLLLEAGTVVDPAGNTIIRVTPYECALGAGDHFSDMTPMIASYFSMIIDGGEKERARQYARYKPYIDAIPKQKPDFDFNLLFEVITNASLEDVKDALGDKQGIRFQRNSELNRALAAFREHFVPRVIKSGMHYNYANPQEAFTIYSSQRNKLIIKFKKSTMWSPSCDLVEQQVIGHILRGMPACDRQAYAQGLYDVIKGEQLERSFKMKYGLFSDGDFPINVDTHSYSGLGLDFCPRTGRLTGHDFAMGWRLASIVLAETKHNIGCSGWNTYIKQKHAACRLMQPQCSEQKTTCVIC